MLQKAAKMRLFAFKTSQLRSRSAPTPHLLRSENFCYVCIGENHQSDGRPLLADFITHLIHLIIWQ